MLFPQTTLNCNGQLLDVANPIVMGILNITSDSFYANSRFNDEKSILVQVEKMLSEGASVIDIGAMSSRPGATFISEKEELQRIIPTLQLIKQHFPSCIVSVDTWRANIAKASVEIGAGIINDISGGQYDEKLFDTIAACKNIPFVLMHIKGTPDTMQDAPQYDNVLEEVLQYFIQKAGQLRELGVKDIVLDPGFGFGKTIDHNYQLLKNMHLFKILDMPLLAGISRKSMIYKYLNTTPEAALNGTTALHIIALQQGAKILRVHDVKAAMEVIKLFQKTYNA